MRHGVRQGEAYPASGGLGASRRLLGLLGSTCRQPATREQLEVVGSPPVRDPRKLLAACGQQEQLDRSLGLAGLVVRVRERHSGVGGDEAVVQATSQVHGLFSGRESERHVARRDRGEGSAKQVPPKLLPVG